MIRFLFPALTSNQKIERHLKDEPINYTAQECSASAFRYANHCALLQSYYCKEVTTEQCKVWDDRRILAIAEARVWRSYV